MPFPTDPPGGSWQLDVCPPTGPPDLVVDWRVASRDLATVSTARERDTGLEVVALDAATGAERAAVAVPGALPANPNATWLGDGDGGLVLATVDPDGGEAGFVTRIHDDGRGSPRPGCCRSPGTTRRRRVLRTGLAVVGRSAAGAPQTPVWRQYPAPSAYSSSSGSPRGSPVMPRSRATPSSGPITRRRSPSCRERDARGW